MDHASSDLLGHCFAKDSGDEERLDIRLAN